MKVEEVCREIFELEKARIQLNKELDEELYLLRKGCEHKWKYYSDASGNNDSEWGCACGTYVKRLPK